MRLCANENISEDCLFQQVSSSVTAERVSAALALRDDWTGHFSVVDDFGIRMRVLPKIP
jgi:hypothetical protein